MPTVFSSVSISLDGFMAAPGQSLENPMGVGGIEKHRWQFEAADENRTELDAIVDAGAFVMGRNMFAPGRGEWDPDWRGWWGENPPYHGPVFVLTHFAREPLELEGGNVFHFVTDGIESALRQARDAAGDRDISIAGGAATVNQFLAAGHIDELHLHFAPITLGAGERLFDGVPPLKLEPVSSRTTSLVTHTVFRVVR
jgi:dihydrofolate reductase